MIRIPRPESDRGRKTPHVPAPPRSLMLGGMKVSAVLTQTAGRWLAHCQEVERVGEGDTPEQALAALREDLTEYFRHAPAVAPPSENVGADIDIDIEVIGAGAL
jgi:hypothetical protein